MHFIIGILLILVFIGCAPKIFKWLLLIDIFAFVVYFIGLYLCMIVIGAGKGGPRSGALADYAIYGIQMMLAAPVIVVVGVFCGLFFVWNKK